MDAIRVNSVIKAKYGNLDFEYETETNTLFVWRGMLMEAGITLEWDEVRELAAFLIQVKMMEA